MKLINTFFLSLFMLAASTAAHAASKANTLLLDTKHGQVAIELLPNKAPNHVKQIRTLANKGFYDGLKFHRVIEGFMAQTGDPLGNGTGGSDLPDLKEESMTFPSCAASWGWRGRRTLTAAIRSFSSCLNPVRFSMANILCSAGLRLVWNM